ncbi:MAG TPA: hypothetical protein VGS06_36185 [Streptosporangiaceae bacterium]|nr:hypothetical protein [Streptosporangiaceae bacterium]
MLLPWPSKHEREAAIAAAREEKESSQAEAAHAADIGRQIRRAQEENSFARAIAQAFRGEAGR